MVFCVDGKMPGLYYDKVDEIMTQTQAWDYLFASHAFNDELQNEVNAQEEEGKITLTPSDIERIEKQQQDEWKANGISHYLGYYLRVDGLVETEFN